MVGFLTVCLSSRNIIKYTFTVFTSTFNRAASMHRVYESLQSQTFRDFEWLIVDDGSEDDTADLVRKWIKEADFPIEYIKQNHAGKHIAWNLALQKAKGYFFTIADSDGAFVPNALEKLLEVWKGIPEEDRQGYRGISCRCTTDDGAVVGSTEIPAPWLDASEADAKYVHKLKYEMWGMSRTEVFKQYPNPNIAGMRFYPESIIWDKMGEKYLTRYINDPLRILYSDQSNATTVKNVNNRYKENYYLWRHILNDLKKYAFNEPLMFAKAAIGIMRDGLLSERRYVQILRDVKFLSCRALVFWGSPIAWVLAKKAKTK
ncbi:glycosyltransferase family 2 protein [Bifidobacterium pseudocatenulatum]|uniref:glycosyltransferase family 2 protein n=1 Tax=Bifidobacterium pseudocatenulatum TaxID=28026 RepID=UPI003D34221A